MLTLPDLLNAKTVRLGLTAEDWQQAIRLAGQPLLETGSVTAAYVDAMVRAVEELGPYMVVAPGIALAHARPEDGVKQACMSLVRLASPIEFGSENDPVDLVLAFGAVDKERHLQALRELADFLGDEEAMMALRRCDSVRKALRLIRQYRKAQGALHDESLRRVMEKAAFELYLDEIQNMLNDVRASQGAEIVHAAEIIAQSVAQGGILHVFGTSHSQLLAQEVFYRAGCLAPTNVMVEPPLGLRKASENCYWYERQEAYGKVVFDSYRIEPGDVILVISTSGRNEVPVEVARQAKERGLKVIALLSHSYCASVAARHSSGKKLTDIADVVLDNRAVLGDAAIEFEGIPHKVGPTSGVIGAAILQALVVQAAQMLAQKGVEPPVWVSVNVPGGAEINARYLEKYRARIKHL